MVVEMQYLVDVTLIEVVAVVEQQQVEVQLLVVMPDQVVVE
jgi:hypothetical protein|tara:strand:- start:306 stop:428 length:123 start_codon:yes stop_codon:yes gene_type:complete